VIVNTDGCDDLVDMDIEIESMGSLKSLETIRTNAQTATVGSKVTFKSQVLRIISNYTDC